MSSAEPFSPPPPRRNGGAGCTAALGNLAIWLLTVIVAALVGLAAAGGLAYSLGLRPDSGVRLALAEQQLLELRTAAAGQAAQLAVQETSLIGGQIESGRLREQVSTLEQQIVLLEVSAEALGDLRTVVAGNERAFASAVAEARAASTEVALVATAYATVLAEGREGRTAVAQAITADASTLALIGDLQRRSQRIERFLQRLGDLAGDASSDLECPNGVCPPAVPLQITISATPSAAASASVTPTGEITPATPTVTASTTPSATATATATVTASATPTATATASETATLTATATATQTPTLTTTPTALPTPRATLQPTQTP